MATANFQDTVKDAVKAYLKYLIANPGGEEIQYRTPFEILINTIKLPHRQFSIIQEDRHSGIEVAGTPDFFVYENDKTLLKRLVGFIECKKPSYHLEKLINSGQINKYSKTCENIILTNYARFILLQKNRTMFDITLENKENIIIDFCNLFLQFCQYEYPYINNKKTLAKTLAAQSFYYSVALREFINEPENVNDIFYIKFNGLFSEYQKSVNYHYELADFCDIYSQSLVYGLMLARIDTGKSLDELDLEYLRLIPADYKLLIEFLSQAYESRNLPPSIKVALINIGKNINLINIGAINNEFASIDLGKKNITVYLYEDFLSQYDKLRQTENRRESGVYYTPHEAADFIIRSVNYILKNKFKLNNGFASRKVKTLDFACGTGTFLHSIYKLLLQNNADDLSLHSVKEKILNDVYGFELNFTPYIISHTLLIRYLSGKNIVLENNERLGIYLTNTLDISQHSISAFLPRLKQEHEKSMRIKSEEDLLAIVGNPPYFGGRSRANTELIDGEVSEYKKQLEGETNLQPLDDLYIKFIRFAEWKIEKSGEGVIGIVSNNSFLDGLIHRQMRKYLYNTFDEIYIVNLHGNTQKNEGDKNIFDILIGVCIIFLIKYKKKKKGKTVYYFSTKENDIITKQQKLTFLENVKFSKVNWKMLLPQETANYWFVTKDFSEKQTYVKFIKITDIFCKYSSGIVVGNDKFCVKYSLEELKQLNNNISKNNNINTIRENYKVADKANWKLSSAINDFVFSYNPVKILYRPFDYRFTSLSNNAHGFLERPRYEIMRNFENKENIGISFVRQLSDIKPYSNVIISNCPIEQRVNYSFQGGAYIAPLFKYEENYDVEHPGKLAKTPNFTRSFHEKYLNMLNWKPAPEDVMSYIYAVLHSPIYRAKYIEFIKTEFPAVPMTKNKLVFNKYVKFGKKLIDLHLLKNLPEDKSIIVAFSDVKGTFIFDKLEFAGNSVNINVSPVDKTSKGGLITFKGVPASLYDFEIGGRKPIDLWIKNRIKDKVPVNINDLQHIKNMIISIKGTIKIIDLIKETREEYLIDI